TPAERTGVAARPGGPRPVAGAAPGGRAPHDPGPEADDRPPLAPPDTTVWGPAQRRLGADEIALQWAVWREQVDDSAFPAPGSSATPGDGGASADGVDGGGESGQQGHSGIRRVLAEARTYIDSPPPLGRVRSSFAPGDARTLRADGPGWSLVARTDDIAFVLLDEEPGEVLPVGRGPELPGLLAALDKMAVRPN
ncbi:hypothetical protein AB0E64_40335, partial [Streptomyces caelestis]|uniref:hypothetical protein n=1 Tax=Streptomyces caelestis TaxID=36816 RepID=UPI0033F1E116